MVVNAFLIIVAIVLLGCLLLGAKKGFVHTVFTMFSLVIIVVLTALLSPFVSNYITEHTQISSSIRSSIEQKIKLENKINTPEVEHNPTAENYIDQIDLPEQLKDLIKDKSKKAGDLVSATTAEARKTLVNSIYDRITELIVDAIAYLFTFAVLVVVFLIAGLLLDILAKLPVIRTANTILGAVVGLIQGYVIVSVMYVASLAFSSTALGTSVIEMVNESEILTVFYEHNIIVDLIFGMLK